MRFLTMKMLLIFSSNRTGFCNSKTGTHNFESSPHAWIMLHAARHRLPEVCLHGYSYAVFYQVRQKFRKRCSFTRIHLQAEDSSGTESYNSTSVSMSHCAACQVTPERLIALGSLISFSRRIDCQRQSFRFTTSKGVEVAPLL